VGKITEASAPTIQLDAIPSGPLMPPPPSSPQFYARCPSCYNPPNLSWLGTGTKYAGLDTWRLGCIQNCNRIAIKKLQLSITLKSIMHLTSPEEYGSKNKQFSIR